MTAHIVFRALDAERPATLSKKVVTGILRESLGYDGLIVSDDLEMRAIADHWPTGLAAVEAIRAGCDVLLICATVALLDEARDALASEAERDESFAARLRDAAQRVRAVRATLWCEPLDDDALDAALADPEAAALRDELSSL